MASVRGNLLGSEKEVESLNEKIQEMTKEAEANHEISKKLQVRSFPQSTMVHCVDDTFQMALQGGPRKELGWPQRALGGPQTVQCPVEQKRWMCRRMDGQDKFSCSYVI